MVNIHNENLFTFEENEVLIIGKIIDSLENSHIQSVSERQTLHLRKTDIYINYIWIHNMETEVKIYSWGNENKDGKSKVEECVTMCGICTKYNLCLHRNIRMSPVAGTIKICK